tara:strand:- start:1887 stop:2999 length:1113 start_codon:yes stop_codon:yes gene_type:complete
MQRISINFAQLNRCVEHGTMSTLPCAWPDCPNGITDEEFEDQPFLESDEPERWKRKRWESPLGGTYYSWESSKIPNWFQTPQTFWNEARRLQLVSESHPSTVYHYTSLEGFMGIVSSRSVWMTEFAYLNDRREIRYGLDLLSNEIGAMLDGEITEQVRDLLLAWKEKLSTSTNRVWVTSFSADDDSLSQWRAYGPIAIGFPVQSLQLHVADGRFQNTEYDQGLQSKLARVYLHHLVSSFEADFNEGKLDRVSDLYHNSDRLLELAVFFKHPAFISEHEYRLAYIDLPEVMERLGLESPSRLFRAAKGRLIPYVTSTQVLNSYRKPSPLEISEVVLGPESDELLDQGIREFLNEYGLEDVIVRRSTVPLRP